VAGYGPWPVTAAAFLDRRFEMDLINLRHRRERKIARDLAREFMRNVTSSETIARPELLAEIFGTVCQKFDFVPSEVEAKRILEVASRHVARQRHKADRLLLDIGGSRG
jgi:hypothetical protein